MSIAAGARRRDRTKQLAHGTLKGMRSRSIDGFRLHYARRGSGAPVVLLHGWPGDHGDWARVVDLLADRADVVVPDLRGFGRSDRHRRDPSEAYSAEAQCRSVAGLIDELELERPVVAGFDVGSRVARRLAARGAELGDPELRGLVLGPPLPGIGDRVLTAAAQREFWYQEFHQLELADRLLDGDPDAVRSYLEHFWVHWSGPGRAIDRDHLERLTALYGDPGAFVASIAWYRAGCGAVASALVERTPAPADRIALPVRILLPEHDPLFPAAWADQVDRFFAAAEVRRLPHVGHFVPVQAPEACAGAILELLVAGA